MTFFIWLTATTRLMRGSSWPALHFGDHQPAGVLLLGKQCGLLQVPPFGDEQFDRVPVLRLLLRCSSESGGASTSATAAARSASVTPATSMLLAAGQGADDVELVAELLDLVDAEFDAQPVGQRFVLLGVGARHHDDRLGGGEPQVRCAHHDQRRAGVAFGVEGVQVRVAAPALLRQLLASDRALGFGHAAGRTAGHADDGRADALADVGVAHLQIRRLGLGALRAAVHPQRVGELVEVTVGAGQQVLGGNRGAFALPRSSPGGPPRPGQLLWVNCARSGRKGWVLV